MTAFPVDLFFELFDTDGSGTLEFKEIVCGLALIAKGAPEEKVKCTAFVSFLPRNLILFSA